MCVPVCARVSRVCPGSPRYRCVYRLPPVSFYRYVHLAAKLDLAPSAFHTTHLTAQGTPRARLPPSNSACSRRFCSSSPAAPLSSLLRHPRWMVRHPGSSLTLCRPRRRHPGPLRLTLRHPGPLLLTLRLRRYRSVPSSHSRATPLPLTPMTSFDSDRTCSLHAIPIGPAACPSARPPP